MKRGDVVTVAISGDFGKPRAALIVQSDALSAEHTSVIVCPLTSELSDLHAFRVTLVPSDENGLRSPSQVMIDSRWRSAEFVSDAQSAVLNRRICTGTTRRFPLSLV